MAMLMPAKLSNRFVLVDNCLKALQDIPNYHHRQLGTKIIGVTGTNAKTTTKELISTVRAEKYNVLYTQGNFNNHTGVPKTLLRLTKDNDIAVVEMGANHPGEIKTLVNIVEPDFGIITNVGKAHLQGFGSFEGVIKTKGELYDFLRTKPESVVFIDHENEHLAKISHDLKLVKYGTADNDDLCANGKVISCAPFLKFEWRHVAGEWHEVQTHLIGSYNIYNMLAAACIGLYFGVSPEQIDHALTNYIPSNNRSQLTVTQHNKLIVDTYNANPTSMSAALKNFRDMDVKPKMAILGDNSNNTRCLRINFKRNVDGVLEIKFFDGAGDVFVSARLLCCVDVVDAEEHERNSGEQFILIFFCKVERSVVTEEHCVVWCVVGNFVCKHIVEQTLVLFSIILLHVHVHVVERNIRRVEHVVNSLFLQIDGFEMFTI